ncbi:hypothetical protein [Varunaivibrio sulfuroxidans]|uniref:Uncharacterized protein n=1 Tax=Varunaivibrio sulfuroxidans TaxID=1773489 RepID=A0A4R3JJQ2_9PROT|nr:hypothetical protein [Varunaivibrio sulfuroxidans]TCS65120.1 hypothetical protein EDD55_101454 [Varunaivibrio sulfuroxidans]WES29593.1 hypothetical protein P3M64_07990 [Varunaivibrio sulfuroxidans]
MTPSRFSPSLATTFAGWILLLVFTASAFAESGTVFVSGFDDLPLMNGLHEQADGAVTFDSPQGRIVETTLGGRVTRRAVLTFYDETLAQLGWRRVKAGRYVREGEELSLFFSSAAPEGETAGSTDTLFVRFSLAPAP